MQRGSQRDGLEPASVEPASIELAAAELSALDRGHARSVHVEHGRVVKTWSHPSRLQRWRDAARARREHDNLSALHARGVSVPRPLELRRASAGWQVVLEHVEHAVDVQRILEQDAAWPRGPERALRELGRLLARLHDAGLEQRDLHPGNALLDADGRAWAIDFDKARIAQRLSGARLLADLATLCAYARERTTARQRARFALAWWRALPRELRARAIGEREQLPRRLARIEARASALRDAQVRRLARRWLRESSRTRHWRAAARELLIARDLQSDLARTLLDAWRGADCAAFQHLAAAHGWSCEPCASPRVARARWLACAREFEHASSKRRLIACWIDGDASAVIRA